MLFLCGIPLLYMELAMGQFTRRGPVGALQKLCPFFQGNSHFYLPLQTGLEQRDIRKEERIQKYDGKGDRVL